MKGNNCNNLNGTTIVTGRVVRMDVPKQGANLELLQQRPHSPKQNPLTGQVGVSDGFAGFSLCYAERKNPVISGPGVSRTKNAQTVKMASAKDIYIDQRNPYRTVSHVNTMTGCKVIRK